MSLNARSVVEADVDSDIGGAGGVSKDPPAAAAGLERAKIVQVKANASNMTINLRLKYLLVKTPASIKYRSFDARVDMRRQGGGSFLSA